MDEGLQRAPGVRIGEDQPPETRPVDGAVRRDDAAAEPLAQPVEGRLAGLHRGPRELVGVDRRHAAAAEQPDHGGLARADPAGERHPQHGSRSRGQAGASCSMLFIGRSSPLGRSRGQAGASSTSSAGAIRSSTKVFHSWHCGHCQSSSVLR